MTRFMSFRKDCRKVSRMERSDRNRHKAVMAARIPQVNRVQNSAICR